MNAIQMDRFAGALANRFACGIYITTAGFTRMARQKAASIPHITPVDGDQVAEILLAQGVGVDMTGSLLSRPGEATPAQVRRLLVDYPLDRFVIQGFLDHLPAEGLVRVRAEVWAGLRYGAVLLLREALPQQIARYFHTVEGRDG